MGQSGYSHEVESCTVVAVHAGETVSLKLRLRGRGVATARQAMLLQCPDGVVLHFVAGSEALRGSAEHGTVSALIAVAAGVAPGVYTVRFAECGTGNRISRISVHVLRKESLNVLEFKKPCIKQGLCRRSESN